MWLHDTSIGQRLTLGFGFSFLLVLLLIGLYFFGQQRQSEAFRRLADQVIPMSEAARDIETAYLRQSAAAHSYIYSGEDRYLAEYRQAVALAQEATERLNRLPLRPEGRALFQQIQRLAAHYTEGAGKAIALRQQGEVLKAKRAIQREMLSIREDLLEKTGAYVALQLRRRDESKSEVDRVRTEMAWTSVALSLLILGFGALVSFFVSRSVSGPARTLVLASRALARGDFEPALTLSPRLDDLPGAQSARDELRVLTAAFGSMARELLHRENRLSAQARLSSMLASSIDAVKVACDAVREIAEQTHCEFGLVYAHDGETHLLKRVGAYSLDGAPETLQVGEGIPGEAASSRRTVLVRDIPADTPFRVRFGFDHVPPRTIVAMPMACQDRLVGTILLGSLRDLSDDALGFIETASQQLAISLQNALSHQQMATLAEELQEKNELLEAQNEEIQAQSEEIQSQNEELQRQNEEIQSQSEEIHAQREELLARREELEEADRHKDEFLAMLAHELRNPLGALSNVVEVARLHGASDPSCSQVHTILNRQVRHMARLLDDLLDVSRITRGKVELRKERVDLAAAVAHAIETTRPLIEARGHDLQISLPPEPVQLEADPTRLEQVLVNLLDNAVKYTGPGGRIWLTAEREEAEAVLRVRDSGVGIPPELLPRVFDLFTQGDRSLDRSQGGLGIGLTMVRSLVEMHEGSVEAHSAGPGKGSELVIRLPALPASSTSKISASHPMALEGAQGKSQRILLVDDNVDAAQMLALCLEMWGHQVRVVHNGPEAIAAAMEDHPEIVLLDIGLPGMDGYEVARRLREQVGLSEARLVALTGYAQEDARTRSRETGFDHHLIKPIAPAELQQLLATLSKGP